MRKIRLDNMKWHLGFQKSSLEKAKFAEIIAKKFQ